MITDFERKWPASLAPTRAFQESVSQTMMTMSIIECQKILEPFLDLCVSSLREGHANLLCIVPILTDVAEATQAFVVYWI